MGDWSSLGDAELTVFTDHEVDRDRLIERLARFDVIVAMRERTPFPREVLQRLPGLRLLVTTGMRNAAIDLDAAEELGITVCGTYATVSSTAELTWGLILGLLRHIPAEDASIRAGGWQRYVGGDLSGRTLGVVGVGHLGSQVATVGRAFNMDIIAWSQNLTEERANGVGARLVTKDELFSTADIVTIHLILSERTRGLVGGRELRLMKPTALLINTSRGPIVDEEALVKVLEEGRIAGAGIDVFSTEPLPLDHPFRRLPNTVVTPHIGYVTAECYEVFYRHIVEAIAAYAAGAPVRVLTGTGR
jgi:phosphoglycerate dehydrogenase-like enzyme